MKMPMMMKCNLLHLLFFLPLIQSYAPNFITKIITSSQKELSTEESPLDEDEYGRVQNAIITTRFPPEPNGYLHLGHAKAINFNFAVARMFDGRCHLRMDDTNPSKEDEEYVQSIIEDVRWMQSGLPSIDPSSKDPWYGPLRKTSDYFSFIYDCAISLIKSGDAYVESLSADEMREYRGTLTEVGKDSPYRERSVEENLELFEGMKNGQHKEGEHVLRAKISMSSPNLNLRDPTLYRIKHESHPATGDTWCIYPMYDFSHPISDALESITHSLCTLEFEDHRPLYDWIVDKLYDRGMIALRPRQIEFSRLNLKHTVLSKRKLIQLIQSQTVSSWNDPRMPTLSGIRRRGVPPSAIRLFCERIGISKSDSYIDFADLENCARDVLDEDASRAFCILDPLKVTITNWGEGGEDLEEFDVPRHPKVSDLGQRTIPFGKQLFIERNDFFDTEGGSNASSSPPKGFKRLVPNGKVRLKYAYVIQCDDILRDENNVPVELKCTFFPETRAGVTPKGEQRVKGIIQWVEQTTAVTNCQVHLYDRLFVVEEPGDDFLKEINPHSLEIKRQCVCEPSVRIDALKVLTSSNKVDDDDEEEEKTEHDKYYNSDLRYQFERCGYFALDEQSNRDTLIFNRVVTLRDTWGAEQQQQQQQQQQQTKESSAASQQRQRNRGNNQPLPDARRIALRAATIKSAKPHPEADNLLICEVSCGEDELRTVVAGLAGKVSIQDLVDRKIVVMTNLKPAKMRGVESTAMLLAASSSSSEDDGDGDGEVELLTVPKTVPDGELFTFEGMEEPMPDEMLKSKGAQKVWDRVKKALKSNGEGEVMYLDEQEKEYKLTCSEGVVKCDLKDAIVQ